jgi:7-carboxy-7-deazaguanine synthase
MKINEIFTSYQGEGPFAGSYATFLRVSGCNLDCSFCDTDHENGKDESVRDIIHAVLDEMNDKNTNFLIITGGEPLIYYNELQLIVNSVHKHFNVQIETNGTLMRVVENAFMVISPKKTKEYPIFDIVNNYKDNPLAYFKFLIKSIHDVEYVKEIISILDYDHVVYLQPEHSHRHNLTKEILKLKLGSQFKLSGQLQKCLGAK